MTQLGKSRYNGGQLASNVQSALDARKLEDLMGGSPPPSARTQELQAFADAQKLQQLLGEPRVEASGGLPAMIDARLVQQLISETEQQASDDARLVQHLMVDPRRPVLEPEPLSIAQ